MEVNFKKKKNDVGLPKLWPLKAPPQQLKMHRPKCCSETFLLVTNMAVASTTHLNVVCRLGAGTSFGTSVCFSAWATDKVIEFICTERAGEIM